MGEVHTKTGMLINYHTAWRAKQKALKMLFGSFEESYNNAPRLLQKIAMTNPGTQWAMADEPIRLDDGSYSTTDRYLIRLFWSFGQCIEAFRHCRPVVCVDATFLSGKFHGTLMTAMAADANNQIIPLAFAMVESENNDSWLWFLTLVRTRVVGNRERVCVISDRNKGLLHALDVLHDSTNCSIAWPDVERRWCMRHLGANLYTRYRSKSLVKRFKGLCLQNQQAKFNEIWRELNETTRKMMADQQAGEDQLRAQMVGGQTIVSRSRGTFSQWIAGKPAERWALIHDTHGARYSIMTTNIAEAFNNVLKGVRGLPLCAIIELTFYRTADYFRDRGNAAMKCSTRFSPKVEQIISRRRSKAHFHRSRIYDLANNDFEVMCRRRYASGYSAGDTVQQCQLGPNEVKCTCNKPKLHHIPCSHVLAACRDIGGNDGSQYVSPYFTIDALRSTWLPKMRSFNIGTNYKSIEGPKWVPYPRARRTDPGRPRSTRLQGDMDEADAVDGLRRCKLCKQPGHDRRTCPTRQ
ncbi:uncharacterized protein LOC133918660 [Phragmites australis]|uniref:uncharacterized protein LOC133918660 n=1 Tax=Phragmites australis TaxID=29695 RepID=UPI002D768287|nr:uncharacterized protein LOC133918660 [Phragmites australis]